MLLNHKLPVSFLFKKVRVELLLITIYALGIEFMDEYLGIKSLSIPLAIPALLGTTISLILAFRTNQAYDRWWEGRKIWGAIVNDSRTLIRQVLSFTSRDLNLGKRFVNRQVAWCYALGCKLRALDPMDRLQRYLTEEELSYVKFHTNIPNAILNLHAFDLQKIHDQQKINNYQQVSIDATLARLTDSMGMAERIKSTVFPKTYSLFIDFMLILFILMLPFGIIEFFGIIEGLIVIAVAIPFILLEKTAVLMQDPFENMPTDTPVFTISETIKTNLLQMVEDDDFEINDYSYGYYSM